MPDPSLGRSHVRLLAARLLTFPLIVLNDDLFKGALKTAVHRAARIDAHLQLIERCVHMCDSHLQPRLAIKRILQQEVAAALADPIPHAAYRR